jgi:ribosomal protein S18 acetylase RimI-like enzyme
MEPRVRPARVDDDAAPGLLYESAAPYYDAYAGSERRARRMLEAVWAKPGHTASWDHCRVAEVDERVAGVLVAFPAVEGDRLARRFLAVSLARLPAWRWPLILRHLRASSVVTPIPPGDSLYVDALAVAGDLRRRGIAKALLAEAERMCTGSRCSGIVLDTGLENAAARALYEGYGFSEREVRRAPDARVERAVGGPGFISYSLSSSDPLEFGSSGDVT